MKRLPLRLLIPVGVAALVAIPVVGLVRAPAAHVHASSSSSQGQALCIGHLASEYTHYTSSCTGHDEPEIDPLSTQPGSAQNITWTVVLPSDGSTIVDSVGPTSGSAARSPTPTACSARRSSSCSSTRTA